MKACGYCGQQNDEQSHQCSGCGTALTEEQTPNPSSIARWRPQSALGLALATGIGAVFIATGVYLCVGRMCLDFNGSPIHPLPMYNSFIIMPPTLHRVLSIGAIVFIVAVCKAQSRKLWQGVITAGAAVGFAACFKLAPSELIFLLPITLMFGAITTSLGFYLGVVLQLALGAWLVGWIPRRN